MTHYRAALRIIEPESPSWRPSVWAASALTGAGLPELWQEIERHRAILEATGELAGKRRRQQVWMWSMLDARLLGAAIAPPRCVAFLLDLELRVAAGSLNATVAVDQVLAAFGQGKTDR